MFGKVKDKKNKKNILYVDVGWEGLVWTFVSKAGHYVHFVWMEGYFDP